MTALNNDDFQAHMDAETLATAEVIKGDKSRLSSAQVKAAELAQNKAAEAKGMAKVSGKPAPRFARGGVTNPPSQGGSFFNNFGR